MRTPRSLRQWLRLPGLRLPGRIALLLGIGALSAAGAKADIAGDQRADGMTRVPLQSAKNFGDVLVWTQDGRIYVSERGGAGEELRLGDTPEARRLREILERDANTPDRPRTVSNRIILAGAGGSGFQRGSHNDKDAPAGQKQRRQRG